MTALKHIGPELRRLLALDADRVIGQRELERSVSVHLLQTESAPPRLLALVTELIAARLPLVALKLLTRHTDSQHDDDFAVVLLHAAATMAAGDLAAAKKNLSRAHQLRPEEIAVHYNFTILLRAEGNATAAARWLRAGLQIERDAVQLWLAARELYRPSQLLALAEELLSWRGGSLYLQLTGEVAAALSLYRRIFASGARGGEFLIEFTGALGHQDCHDELTTVAWQLLSQGTLPWQVYEHFAQSFTQLDNLPQAKRCTVLAESARRAARVAATEPAQQNA